MNIANSHESEFTFLDSTSLANRSGISMPFGHLSVGNVMEASYNPETRELVSLNQAFTRDFNSRTGLRIDMEANTITIGNDVLNFTEQTLVLYRGDTRPIYEISQNDTLSIIALQSNILLIEVESGHGFLQLTNFSGIEAGRIILDPIGPGANRVTSLYETITLPEGTYRVTVEGRNIEAFVTEIEIRQGETTMINLADVEPSAAVLELTVSPMGSRVYINGALTSLHAAMEFEFGETLAIRVERDGFYTYERTVEMTQAVVSIHIGLEEETPEPEVGTLHIFSMPAGAQVWVNNLPVGTSPTAVELEPGVVSVMAAAPGFYDYSTVVNIAVGENSVTLIMEAITETPPPFIPTPPPDYDPPDDSPPWYIPPDDDPYDYNDE